VRYPAAKRQQQELQSPARGDHKGARKDHLHRATPRVCFRFSFFVAAPLDADAAGDRHTLWPALISAPLTAA